MDIVYFTFFEDFVSGFVITQTHKDAINRIFNLTTGHAEPIGKLVTILKECFKDLEVIYEPWDNIVPVRGTLNIDRLREIGYDPEYRIENGYPRYIQWYLDNNKEFRSGIGYDIHKIDKNSKKSLILCGVKFKSYPSLLGHSDADVGFHAICDSIFGSLGLGDIGKIFKNTNPKWKDIDSKYFL